ncbi:hypothetical protein CLOM_g7254 [Closterium sp. NIES-68]|nr:hypothetical protein CLOM_g7254 [Closterium sp. NIES-68]GJP83252.1 hypothetical protein CLOP_g13425 [Closterium sp. NIES-67]
MASEACSTQSDCPASRSIAVDVCPAGAAAEGQDGGHEAAGARGRGAERLVHLIPVVLMLSMAVLWTFQKDVELSPSVVHSSSHLSISSTLHPSSFKADRRLLDGAVHSSDVVDSAAVSPNHRRSTLGAGSTGDDSTARDEAQEGSLGASFRALQELLRPLGMA